MINLTWVSPLALPQSSLTESLFCLTSFFTTLGYIILIPLTLSRFESKLGKAVTNSSQEEIAITQSTDSSLSRPKGEKDRCRNKVKETTNFIFGESDISTFWKQSEKGRNQRQRI